MVLFNSSDKANFLYAAAATLTPASDHDNPFNLSIHCKGVAYDK